MKVTIYYEDGVRCMVPSEPDETRTQEISRDTWCRYNLFLQQERNWQLFLRRLDNFAFAAEDDRED